MTFGERLLKARKAKGYTQEQLAEFIGVAKSTYTGYEKNSREPDLFKIKRLIEILGVSSSWLLGVDENDGFTANEWKMIKKYRALDERGKAAVDMTLEREHEESTRAAGIATDVAETVREVGAAYPEKRPAGQKR